MFDRIFMFLVSTSYAFIFIMSMGDENLKSFINGQYVFARPNYDIKTFLFDPTNGEKIDWKLIRKAFNAHFDYIEKNK